MTVNDVLDALERAGLKEFPNRVRGSQRGPAGYD
jgi:hypothetical protein